MGHPLAGSSSGQRSPGEGDTLDQQQGGGAPWLGWMWLGVGALCRGGQDFQFFRSARHEKILYLV